MAIEEMQSPLNRARQDKYLFIMNLPDALRDISNAWVNERKALGISREAVAWTLVNTAIPSMNIKAQSIKFGGGNLYISSHTKDPYDALKISFKIDNKFLNYSTIHEWIDFIYNERQGHFDAENISKEQGINAYTTNISIAVLDEYNKPVMQWLFTHAFPTEISNIDLNYQNSDEIICNATFMFSQMYVENLHVNKLITKKDK